MGMAECALAEPFVNKMIAVVYLFIQVISYNSPHELRPSAHHLHLTPCFEFAPAPPPNENVHTWLLASRRTSHVYVYPVPLPRCGIARGLDGSQQLLPGRRGHPATLIHKHLLERQALCCRQGDMAARAVVDVTAVVGVAQFVE